MRYQGDEMAQAEAEVRRQCRGTGAESIIKMDTLHHFNEKLASGDYLTGMIIGATGVVLFLLAAKVAKGIFKFFWFLLAVAAAAGAVWWHYQHH
jgi:hypothetical protein